MAAVAKNVITQMLQRLYYLIFTLVPTHMKKDDNQLTSGAGQSSELPTRVVWKKRQEMSFTLWKLTFNEEKKKILLSL